MHAAAQNADIYTVFLAIPQAFRFNQHSQNAVFPLVFKKESPSGHLKNLAKLHVIQAPPNQASMSNAPFETPKNKGKETKGRSQATAMDYERATQLF